MSLRELGKISEAGEELRELISKRVADSLIINPIVWDTKNPNFGVTSYPTAKLDTSGSSKDFMEAILGARDELMKSGPPTLAVRDHMRTEEKFEDFKKAIIDSSLEKPLMTVYYFEKFFYKYEPVELHTDPEFMIIQVVLENPILEISPDLLPVSFSDVKISNYIRLRDYRGVWKIVKMESL